MKLEYSDAKYKSARILLSGLFITKQMKFCVNYKFSIHQLNIHCIGRK